MAQEADFTIPAEDFPLGSIFEDLPDAKVELERLIPTNTGVLPYFWVWNHSPERVLALLESQPAIVSAELVDNVADGALFKATWDTDEKGVLSAIVESGITLLTAEGTSEKWVFKLRAENPVQISEYHQYCRNHGIETTLSRLQSLSEIGTGSQYNLTQAQQEALVLAFNKGYYNDTRETTLEELAKEFGITRTSLSARLRRGYRNLIGSTLIHQAE